MPVFLFTPCGLGGGRTASGGPKDSCMCASSFSWLGSGHLILISRHRNASLSITFGVACALCVTGLSFNFTWKWKVSARRNLKPLQTLIVEPFRAALRSQERLRGGCAFGTAVCVNSVLNYLTQKTAPSVQYWIADLSGVKTFFFRGQKIPRFCVTKATPLRAAWTPREVAIGVAVKDAFCRDAESPRCRSSHSTPGRLLRR